MNIDHDPRSAEEPPQGFPVEFSAEFWAERTDAWFTQRRDTLFALYQASCTSIALLCLHELAVRVRRAFPDAHVLVLDDAESGDHLAFAHVENAAGDVVADGDQVEESGIDADMIASNLGNNDIGRSTWLIYAPHDRRTNAYRCTIDTALAIPPDLVQPDLKQPDLVQPEQTNRSR